MTMMNLYSPTEKYSVEIYRSHDDWKKSRGSGIGGSDAAAFVGCGFKTLPELWDEKIGGLDPQFQGNVFVEYGNKCEGPIRTLFAAKHPDMDVQYIPDAVLISKADPFMRYSPDGLIHIPETGARGILEIKTYAYKSKLKYADDWGADFPEDSQKVPAAYYCQTLHGLLVSGFDFVIFSAEIRFPDGDSKIITRAFTAEEAENDMHQLYEKERTLWKQYFEAGIRPPVTVSI